MVSVLDIIIPSLLRERYLFTCSPVTIIMLPFWFVAVLDVIPAGRRRSCKLVARYCSGRRDSDGQTDGRPDGHRTVTYTLLHTMRAVSKIDCSCTKCEYRRANWDISCRARGRICIWLEKGVIAVVANCYRHTLTMRSTTHAASAAQSISHSVKVLFSSLGCWKQLTYVRYVLLPFFFFIYFFDSCQTNYPQIYHTDLRQIYRVSRSITGVDDQSEISFSIPQWMATKFCWF